MATAVGFTTDLWSDLATSGGLQQGARDWVWDEPGLGQSGGAQRAPARERRGAQGSPQATEPGFGAEPHLRKERAVPGIE